MQSQTLRPGDYVMGEGDTVETQKSGVSWGAILAGAVAAVALSLILLTLGFGLGLSAMSPWSFNATAVGWSTVLWIAFTQLAASAVGGYLAGRLRIKWASVHSDEVYFRDTAHGMLTWALATLITAVLLASTLRAVLSGAIDASGAAANVAGPVASQVARGAPEANPVDYFSDMLLRSSQPGDTGTPAMRGEVLRIFANALRNGGLGADDRSYLARMVATRTGLGQSEAEQRVDQIYANANRSLLAAQQSAREAADSARRTAAFSALWMVVALLLGAFVASLCGTIGGRQRDLAQPADTVTGTAART
jgi:hypothetical protein